MKKMLLLAVAILSVSFVGTASAIFGLGRGRCGVSCPPAQCAVQQACPIPKCYKTVEVPAIERRIKQPDICETIPCPDKVVWHKQKPLVIPQPDICERIPQPAKVVTHKQPDIVTYECPVNATSVPLGQVVNGCPTGGCGIGCR